MTAFHRSPDWAAGVRAAIGSMLNFLASRPAMAHLLGVEAYAGGVKAIARRAQALSPLAGLVGEGYRLAPEVPPVATEAIAGGVAALVYRRLREDGAGSLPGLAPVCTYIALAPFIGAERATIAANGDGRVRATDAFLREGLGDLIAVQPTKPSVLAILGLRSAGAEELAQDLGISVQAIDRYLVELEEEGLIEPVGRDSSGAPTARRQRSALRLLELEEWEQMSQEERERVSVEVVDLIERDIAAAMEAGTFSRRPDVHLTRVAFVVDERGWEELADIHRAAVIASQEVQMRSAKRLKGSGEKGITGRSALTLFEMPDD